MSNRKSHAASVRPLLPGLACLVAAALYLLPANPAVAASTFKPRIGGGLGLVPPVNHQGQLRTGDIASGTQTPETYHGGPVMAGGVRLHTIFWAPPGYGFQGSPGSGIPTYKGMIQQFFSDIAAASGSNGSCTSSDCNVFTVQRQYGQGTSPGQITPGSYALTYNGASDSIDDGDPYPGKADQCASPAGAAVCLTDGQIQSEVDRVVQSDGGARGLHDLWFVFLPAGVDECITAGSCGTNSFAGYHSVSNANGHGATIYAVSIDPIIEAPVGSGADPEGYPDAEVTLDIAAHEVNEAIADPEGNGWMDPNGFEVADKCDTGPQVGQPLGFASDGAPYNQVINGHQYLLQEEWANADTGGNPDCVQATSTTSSQLPLPQVNLRQFNPVITGNVNRASGGGIQVQVSLLRARADGSVARVARASTTTAPDGSWTVSLAPHAVGDDRDEVDVDYSGPDAPQPSHQVILTGNGGNPFTESGWMGWLAMDEGSLVKSVPGGATVALAPCFQAGTLGFTRSGAGPPESPNDFCNTQTDVATQGTAPITPRDALKWTSNDNRAFDAPSSPHPNPLGGLVSLTVPMGEPGAVAPFGSRLTTFTPGGFPTCTADLEFQVVGCAGLVPRERYRLIDRRQRVSDVAGADGTIIDPLRVRRGDSVSLSNGSRTLTTLHVARMRVRILGEETFVDGGTCQPGQYFGAPPGAPPTSTAAGLPSDSTKGGTALTGAICPPDGHASGLPAANLVQTDELSGGQTETEVPDIEDTSPMEGETMYGHFTALAESGLTVPGNQVLPADAVTRISLRIYTGRGTRVLSIRNVDKQRGATVPALVPGSYLAVWTLTDLSGDTRVVVTRFIEQRGRSGGGPMAAVVCLRARGARLRCRITFRGYQFRGQLRMRLTRGATVVALGHGGVRRGQATITMSELTSPGSGAWRATLVLSQGHIEPVTIRAGVRGLG